MNPTWFIGVVKLLLMKKIFCFLFIFLLLLSFPKKTAVYSADTCSPEAVECQKEPLLKIKENYQPQFYGKKVCVYYFWGAGCKNCEKIAPLMENLEKKYQNQAEFKKLEIYFDNENRALFEDFINRYQVKNPGVPAVFLGDIYLSGSSSIEEHLDFFINDFYQKVDKIICPLEYKKIEGNIEKSKKLSLTLTAVILASLADSINPCAFSILIFLIVYLLALKAKQKILKIGLIYIFTIFLTYFAAGLGFLNLISKSQLFLPVSRIAAFIAVFAGIINVKDFFFYGQGISLSVPASKKPLLEKYIRKASMPAAVILGFLVSAFELPCTGGIYLAILSLIAKNKLAAVPYLFIYNLIFIFPLLLILFAAYQGVGLKKLRSFQKQKRRWLRLIMGLMMIVLGFYLWFN